MLINESQKTEKCLILVSCEMDKITPHHSLLSLYYYLNF